MKINLGILGPLAELGRMLPNPLPYPPMVTKDLYLIDGSKRLNRDINSVLVAEEYEIKKETDQAVFWLSINSKHRTINEMEKAIVINECSAHCNKKDLVGLLSPYFDISEDMIEDYKKYLTLPMNIKRFIANESPPKNLIKLISAVPEKIRKNIDAVLKDFTPNASLLKNYTELLSDINSKGEYEKINFTELNEIARNSGLKDAVERLSRTRSPKLSNMNTKLKSEIRSLGLSRANIGYDDKFEANGITISANIRSEKDLEKFREELGKMKIRTVLEIYNGEK